MQTVSTVLYTIPWFAWIPIVAIICGTISGVVASVHRHTERMAMIRMGIHPDAKVREAVLRGAGGLKPLRRWPSTDAGPEGSSSRRGCDGAGKALSPLLQELARPLLAMGDQAVDQTWAAVHPGGIIEVVFHDDPMDLDRAIVVAQQETPLEHPVDCLNEPQLLLEHLVFVPLDEMSARLARGHVGRARPTLLTWTSQSSLGEESKKSPERRDGWRTSTPRASLPPPKEAVAPTARREHRLERRSGPRMSSTRPATRRPSHGQARCSSLLARARRAVRQSTWRSTSRRS